MLILLLNILLFVTGADELKIMVDDFLKNNLTMFTSYEFQIIKQPENYSSISIDENNLFNLNGHIATIPVRVTYSDNSVQQNHLVLRMKLFKEVFIAAKPISRNKILAPGDFKKEVKEVTHLRGTPVESVEELFNMKSKSSILTGSVLMYESFQLIPVVNAGDKVTAQSNAGNVMITVEAFARQDGAEGEIIKIQTKDKKQFKARVLNFENVLIIE